MLSFCSIANGYTALVAFGDSYTDTGNAPSSPPDYWSGRFSNGPLWVEDLSQTLGFGYNPANNYAVSGSESDELGLAISKFPGTGDSANTLFAIWSGNNDLANHLDIGYDDAAWTIRINGIVSSLTTASDLLYKKGARQLILFNQMDLTRCPDILNSTSASFRNYILGKIQIFNSQLSSAIPGLLSSHPGLQVYFVDIYNDFNYLLNNYASLGFAKANVGALNDPALFDKSFSGSGTNYVFWDSQHPTAKTHALIAVWVAGALPPPSPPSVAITTPQSGAQFTAPADVALTAAVSANGWAISGVSLIENGNVAETLTGAPFNFQLSSLPAGFYSLAVQLTYGSGQTLISSPIQVSVAPPPGSPPPSPWTNSDIGSVGPAGSTYSTTDGTFFVTGAGSDIWDVADSFQFAYQPFAGDGSIIAKVSGLQNTDPFAKAGVMLRETLDPGARNVMVFVTPTSGTGFQDRIITNGLSTYGYGNSGSPPIWLKLERQGTNFNAYGSADGTNWTRFASTNIGMASTNFAGLAVTSHNNSLLNTATFSNATVSHPTPIPPAPPVPPNLSITQLTNGVMQLSISGTRGSTYVCQSSTNLVDWFPMATNQNISGTIRFQLSPTAPKDHGFYRALLVP